MYMCTYVHVCVMYPYICKYMYMRTYMHTYIHAYVHTYIHTYIHTYTCTVYVKLYIHTRTARTNASCCCSRCCWAPNRDPYTAARTSGASFQSRNWHSGAPPDSKQEHPKPEIPMQSNAQPRAGAPGPLQSKVYSVMPSQTSQVIANPYKRGFKDLST